MWFNFFDVSHLFMITATAVSVGYVWKNLLRHGVTSVTYLHENKSRLVHIELRNVSWLHIKVLRGTVYTLRDVILHAFAWIYNRLLYITDQKTYKDALLTNTRYDHAKKFEDANRDQEPVEHVGCYVIDMIYPPHKTFTRFITLDHCPAKKLDVHDFKHVKWIHVTCNHKNMSPYLKSVYVSPEIRLRHLHLYLQNITRNENLAPMYEVITRSLDDEVVYDMNTIVS